MTHSELHSVLQQIGWDQRELARRLGVHHSRVSRMCAGSVAVPDDMAARLRALAAVAETLMPRQQEAAAAPP